MTPKSIFKRSSFLSPMILEGFVNEALFYSTMRTKKQIKKKKTTIIFKIHDIGTH